MGLLLDSPWRHRGESAGAALPALAATHDHAHVVTRVRPRDAGHAAALVAEVAAAHRGISRFQICPQSGPWMREPLIAAGYRLVASYDAMVVQVDGYAPAPHPGVRVEQVTTLEGLRDNRRMGALAFGRPMDDSEEELAQQLRECTEPGCRVQRFVARDGRSAQPLSGANMNLFPQLNFAFLWAGGTAPAARGRGAYRALVAARVARAKELGLSLVGLYAKLDSSAPILDRLGFERFGRMEQWDRPG